MIKMAKKVFISFAMKDKYLRDFLVGQARNDDYGVTFEPHVSLELCQLFRGSCAIQFG